MRKWTLLLAGCASAAVGAMPAAACAQEASSADTAADIIVTARGRDESLLRAPVADTAFSNQAISDANLKQTGDALSLVPNVSFTKSESAGTAFITIRGISQVRNGESPVAVVVDGVQQVTSRQFTQDLYDIEQMEVLRGPQGALYGRNAIGGAILITTRKPTNDFTADARASYGNGDDYRVAGSVSGPIIRDKVQFRITGSYHDYGGLLNNVTLGKKVDYARDTTLRGQLHFDLAPGLTADWRGSYAHTRAGSLNFVYQPAKFDAANPCSLDAGNPFGGPAPDANRVTRTMCANNLGYDRRDLYETSLKVDYDAGFATFSNVVAYTDLTEETRADQFPYTASRNVYGTDGTQTQFERVKAWSDEFRITSSADRRLRWMVGAYFLDTRRFISSSVGEDTGQGILSVRYTPHFDDATNPTLSFLADHNRNRSYAFFGNLSYDVTRKLEASVAFRYDHDRHRQIIRPDSTAGVPAGCTATASDLCTRQTSFHRSQPKITLNYKPTANLTVFADYGIGFRSGQYNQAGAAAAASLPGVFDLAKPESAYTTEGGVKASLLGGKLRLSATAFHTIDKNSFYFLFVGAVGAQILVNIDKAELNGAEFEAQFTPVRGLDLFGNFGFTDSKIKDFAYNQALVGNKAPYIPRDGGLIGVQYRSALTDRFGLFSRLEMEHHGKQYWEPENSTARNAFQLVNAQLGLEGADKGWSVTGYVRNAFDKKYNAEYVSGGFALPAQPRTYGIELKGKF